MVGLALLAVAAPLSEVSSNCRRKTYGRGMPTWGLVLADLDENDGVDDGALKVAEHGESLTRIMPDDRSTPSTS